MIFLLDYQSMNTVCNIGQTPNDTKTSVTIIHSFPMNSNIHVAIGDKQSLCRESEKPNFTAKEPLEQAAF